MSDPCSSHARLARVLAFALFVHLGAGAAPAATPMIAAGLDFGVAVDESGRAWRWGHDEESPGYPGGQCPCSPPEPVPGPGGAGQLSSIVAVAASQHALALAADGTVWTWGYNADGQLGRGITGAPSDQPQQVVGPDGTGTLSGIIAIAAGWEFSLALKSDGTVWSWGRGSVGQLGHDAFTSSSIPVQVRGIDGAGFLTGADAVDAGFEHAVVLIDGAAYTFGADVSGQRGGASAKVPVAVQASNGGPVLSGVAQASSGWSYSLFRMNDGTVLSWGSGFRGQLGNGRQEGDGLPGSIHHPYPASVKSADGTGTLSGITIVSAGAEHALARRNDGTAWAWGDGSPHIIGGPQSVNALGLGTSTDADGPYQPLPAQVHGLQDTGFLQGVAEVFASKGSAWSVALMPSGVVMSWGDNYFGQLGFKAAFGDLVLPGGGTRWPFEICALRLRDLTPELSCPAFLEPDQAYEISWSAVAGATGYLVSVGDTPSYETTALSHQHVEGPPECSFGFDMSLHVSVAALVETSCEPEEVSCTIPRRTYPEPPAAPSITCPEAVVVGDPIALDWADDENAISWEVDLDEDGVADLSPSESGADLVASGVGMASFRVRGVNPCGPGEWSESCATRVRPDTSQCMTMGLLEACTSGWIEDPPGTFVAESEHIRLRPAGGTEIDHAVWISGALELVPAAGEAYFDGVAWADTVFGRIDLFDSEGTVEPPEVPDGGLSQPSHGGAHRGPRLPLGPDLVNLAFGMGMRSLLSGVPCTTETPANQFVVGCLPFNGQARIWLNLTINLFDWRANCVAIDATFGVQNVPENGDMFLDGQAAICPANPFGLVGSLLTGAPLPQQAVVIAHVVDAEANVAGCRASVGDGWMRRGLTDTTSPYGMSFTEGEITCPSLGNLRADVDELYLGQDDISVEAGQLRLSRLDAGLVTVHDFAGTLNRRDPKELGYRICGEGEMGLPFIGLDMQAGFTLLDGDLQRACVNLSFMKKAVEFLPGVPAYFDKILGGCFTLFPAAGESCSESADFAFASRCLDGCLEPPMGELKLRIQAGIPGPWGAGLLASIDPAGVQFSGEGVRAAGRLKLLGQSVGSADFCLRLDEAAGCAEVDLGILSGSAALGLSEDYGIAGQVTGTVDLPYIGCCGIGYDPGPIGLTAYLGPYEDPEKHYGFVLKVDLLGERLVGLDIRTLKPSLTGIRLLSPFTPGEVPGETRLGESASEDPIVASASFTVPEGAAQALFIAQSSSGVPVLTLAGPDGIVTASTPGVHSLSDDDAAGLGVDDPAPGLWEVVVTGVPLDASVTITSYGEPAAATVDLTLPAAGDTGTLRVEWNATVPSADPETTLRLLASQDPELAAAGVGTLIHSQALPAGPGAHDITEGTLSAGTWWIVAVTDDGIGHVGVDVSDGTITVADTTGPDAPASAEATALHDGARVTWQPSPSPDVAGYEVIVSESDEADPGQGVVLPAGDALELDVHGLTGLSERRYLVRAYDKSLNRGGTVEAGVVAPDPALDSVPPGAPGIPTLQAAGETGVDIAWSAVDGATSYRIHYGVGGLLLGLQAPEGASPVPASSSPFTLTGFVPGQVVRVAVSAVDELGNAGPISPIAEIHLGSDADTDGDGLPDSWEKLFFGDLDSSDGTGDADADFLRDAEELLVGFDPLSVDDFDWGDLTRDGKVDIADVVLALRFSIALQDPDPEDMRRGDVSPATVTPGPPDSARPDPVEPRRISVADVVLMLRAAVGLVGFEAPFPDEER